MVLTALAEGLDPSAAERVFAYRQATITAWMSRAGEHARTLHEHFSLSLAGVNEEVVFNEVKRHLEGAPVIGNSRGGQPARGDIQGGVPPVVEKGGECHTDFANDLCPHVQRITCLLPCFIWQRWPQFHSCSFVRLLSGVHLALHPGKVTTSFYHNEGFRKACSYYTDAPASLRAASSSSCSQDPGYRVPLIKNVGVPRTPLRNPL
jgi:hypothetical protein